MKQVKHTLDGDILGLDLGMSRTGVARVNTLPRLSEPLDVISMGTSDEVFLESVARLINEHNACAVVAGVPRGLDGQETKQTEWALDKISSLRDAVTVPVYEIDEAGTTKAAEQRALEGQSVDSVAACIMLDDFILEVEKGAIADVRL